MSLPSDRWMDVRRRIDDLEGRLRRGRFTVPTYLAATVFFLASGFSTGAWGPASVLAVLSLVAAWTSHRVRRTRLEQIRALHALETSLPDEEAEPADPAAPVRGGGPGADADPSGPDPGALGG